MYTCSISVVVLCCLCFVVCAHAVLQEVHVRPSKVVLLFHHLCCLPPSSLVPYSHPLTSTLLFLLHSPSVSQAVQMHYVTLWTKLNTIISRR